MKEDTKANMVFNISGGTNFIVPNLKHFVLHKHYDIQKASEANFHFSPFSFRKSLSFGASMPCSVALFLRIMRYMETEEGRAVYTAFHKSLRRSTGLMYFQ